MNLHFLNCHKNYIISAANTLNSTCAYVLFNTGTKNRIHHLVTFFHQSPHDRLMIKSWKKWINYGFIVNFEILHFFKCKNFEFILGLFGIETSQKWPDRFMKHYVESER